MSTKFQKYIASYSSNVPRQTSPLRWAFLLLCCISTFGNYYCFDNVGATHDHLKAKFQPHLSNSSFEFYFSLLYTVYSFPNIILPFIGGIFTSFFGYRAMYLVFGIFIIIGQFIFSMGCEYESIKSMLVGRIIFGIGGESINICQSSMIIKWFLKKEISLPSAITLTISRLGSSLNDILSPRISSINDPSKAYWIGFLLSLVSFASIILLCLIDYSKDLRMGEIDSIENNNNNNIEDNENDDNIGVIDKLRHFNSLFWLCNIICMLIYGDILPFNYISTAFFTSNAFKDMKPSEARKKAGIYMSIPFIIGALMAPVFGYLIDKFGKRVIFSLISSLLCFIGFILIYYIEPILPLVLLGFAYSIFASVLWPSISLIVNDKKYLGLAYGITTSFQNFSVAVIPVIIAGLYVKFKNYYACIKFFEIFGFFAVIFNGLIYNENKKYKYILDKVEFEEDDIKEKNDNEEEVEKLITKDTNTKKRNEDEEEDKNMYIK